MHKEGLRWGFKTIYAFVFTVNCAELCDIILSLAAITLPPLLSYVCARSPVRALSLSVSLPSYAVYHSFSLFLLFIRDFCLILLWLFDHFVQCGFFKIISKVQTRRFPVFFGHLLSRQFCGNFLAVSQRWALNPISAVEARDRLEVLTQRNRFLQL